MDLLEPSTLQWLTEHPHTIPEGWISDEEEEINEVEDA